MIIDNCISPKLDTYKNYTLLGKPDAQITYDNQFLPSKKVSLQGYREFATYAGALTYVTTHVSAFPGIIVTVSNDDTADKNGAYLVENDTISDDNLNGLKLTRLAAGGNVEDSIDEKLEWEVCTDAEEVPAE